MMTLTIEIPALDRFCDWLETRDKASVAEELKNEIFLRVVLSACARICLLLLRARLLCRTACELSSLMSVI